MAEDHEPDLSVIRSIQEDLAASGRVCLVGGDVDHARPCGAATMISGVVLSTRERLALGGGRGAEAAAVCGHAGLVLVCLVECGRSASPASVDGTRITTSSTSLSALWWRCLIAALVLGPCILHHTDPAFQVYHFSLC
jgi:hypothetical protein